MLWPCRRVSEAAILLSLTFAFIFSWSKVIVALSLCLFSRGPHHTVHTSIIAAKIVSLKIFLEPQYFSLDLKFAPTKTAIPIRSIQNADCRLGTKFWIGTKCRLQTGYRMQTENLYCFSSYTWWHFILQLTKHHTIDHNIISRHHIVFSLCAQVGWCDVYTEFTN